MWFWAWRSVLLVLCVTAVVLLSKRIGYPWDTLLPVMFSMLVGPPIVQRWRRLYQAHRGTGRNGQERTH